MGRGIRMVGAASIGALRAAELAPYGMLGVGDIYTAYVRGDIDGDDEVAVGQAPDGAFDALTWPLVNLRHVSHLAVSTGVLDDDRAAGLLQALRAVYYPQRTWAAVRSVCRRQGETEFADWLSKQRERDRHFGDLKRADALAAVTSALASTTAATSAAGDLEELGERDELPGPSGGPVQDVGELRADPGGRDGPGEAVGVEPDVETDRNQAPPLPIQHHQRRAGEVRPVKVTVARGPGADLERGDTEEPGEVLVDPPLPYGLPVGRDGCGRLQRPAEVGPPRGRQIEFRGEDRAAGLEGGQRHVLGQLRAVGVAVRGPFEHVMEPWPGHGRGERLVGRGRALPQAEVALVLGRADQAEPPLAGPAAQGAALPAPHVRAGGRHLERAGRGRVGVTHPDLVIAIVRRHEYRRGRGTGRGVHDRAPRARSGQIGEGRRPLWPGPRAGWMVTVMPVVPPVIGAARGPGVVSGRGPRRGSVRV
ncbi:TfuA-like protein [Streptomyces sp. NPDC090029]|uniref:TfuA-like protein n=1 Tax=Streptomyces sp. NPDC090029 TaxID=3365924 RepID=UPI00381B71EB